MALRTEAGTSPRERQRLGVRSLYFGAFTTLGRTLVIKSDSIDVMQYIWSAYARVRISAPPRHTPFDFGSIRYEGGASPSVSFNYVPVVASGSERLQTAFQAAFYGSSRLFRLSMRQNEDWHSIYGAAVCVNGRSLLIAGRPGAGKTTLVLELMRRGAQLYSDEFVFVRKSDKLVFGLPRTLAIREPTLSIIHDHRLEAECARMKPRWSRRGMFVWDFIDAASIFGESAYAQASPLAALLLLDRKTDTQPQLTRISPTTAAAAVARLFNTDDMSFSRFADVSALFVDLQCFVLSMHGVEKAADAVSEALG